MNYDAIVVGGGHAGCEATLALAKMGFKTLLVTGSKDKIAMMPCNPHIGGSAKGIVVREIDALGGMMGKVADKTLLQMKMLNFSKGPAVRSLRAQGDKVSYPKEMQRLLEEDKNVTIIEDMVEDLKVDNNVIKGVVLSTGKEINAKSVILTTGTYMKADILVGDTRTSSGPAGTRPSLFLSDNLEKLGFKILRLKTGTPPRVERSSIDFSKTKMEPGDDKLYTFSFDDKPYYKVEEQEPCYLTYTTEETHKIIRDNLSKSSMYGGIKEKLGTGPRYCPSIEDKIVRFADKERHQLFLEPESRYFDDIYVQGFSTSMPHDVQEKMVHSLPGLENAKILRYAYAIEYDAIDSKDLYPSLETKIIENLYTAGQINGTSGYEEAACQGLMAGINAGLKMQNKESLILKRDEAYIGVLIDDLVTKGVRDPYRLLTSRAEYRLLLRSDNADLRLRKYGYEVGLINKKQYNRLVKKEENINKIIEELNSINIKDSRKMNGIEYVKRTENSIFDIKDKLSDKYDELELEQAEIMIKYEGYIKKARKEAEKMRKLENKKIPADIDYDKVPNLASEARIKLKEVRPLSFSQASRISGVNPSDIAILSVYMKRYFDEYK
ncbi:MAG: tRNA uridine-5-carboxymethylaminomethyl(34) synthesis enzyme MnmG [Bacilli bacterium]|nr:tRNA uridine-5-carboxymethylaminomethyl(34) synthesis enzyme MnmG [Bacilli bacterium]